MVEAVAEIVAEHTAGSPVDPQIRWTNRSPREIAGELAERGYAASPPTVRRILQEDLKLRIRQACKSLTHCHYPFRDEQFQHIAELRDWYLMVGYPVLSIDTKKKENLGDFYRPGSAYTDGFVLAPDHDFPSRAVGKLAPYGVYDVGANQGFMLLSTGPDTSELATDAVWSWWEALGQQRYGRPRRLLLLCDCGGSNGYRQHRFKQDVKDLAIRLGTHIQVAHYPPGCSKYNPIERRMFCHVSRAMQGVILRSLDVAQQCIERTATATGLSVVVETACKLYQKGRKATAEFLERLPIEFDNHLPQLNYLATPKSY